LKRFGEITTKHLKLLPESVVKVWAKGALDSGWGKQWVEEENADIAERAESSGEEPQFIQQTVDGLMAAFYDGRLIISFTVMKCVGYRRDWDDRCLYYKDHPKPPKKMQKKKAPKRKRAQGKQPASNKKTKVGGGREIVKEESEAENSVDGYAEA
jgi:hypothetical protein